MPSLTAPLILKILFSTTDTTFETVNTRKLYFASQYTCCQIEKISENTHTHTHARARALSLRPHCGSGRIALGKYLCNGLFYVNIHCLKDVSDPFGAGIPTAASPSPLPPADKNRYQARINVSWEEKVIHGHVSTVFGGKNLSFKHKKKNRNNSKCRKKPALLGWQMRVRSAECGVRSAENGKMRIMINFPPISQQTFWGTLSTPKLVSKCLFKHILPCKFPLPLRLLSAIFLLYP